MAESEAVKGETTKKGKPRKVGHIKMIVMEDLKSGTVTELVEQNVSGQAKIDSDGSTSYTNLSGSAQRQSQSRQPNHQGIYLRLFGGLFQNRRNLFAVLPYANENCMDVFMKNVSEALVVCQKVCWFNLLIIKSKSIL
jgi:hypothetical protein